MPRQTLIEIIGITTLKTMDELITKKEYNALNDKKKGNYEMEVYDTSYKHGGYEDIDLFLRWKKAGEKLVITPKVAYWHEEGATRFSEKELPKQTLAEVDNRKYFCEKNGFDAHENILNFLKDDRVNF